MALTRGLGAYDDGTADAPGPGTTPRDTRMATAASFSRAGVLHGPGDTTPLVSGTSGWQYRVGRKHFVTQRSLNDGMQAFANDGAVDIGTTGVGSTVPSAPGAGLSRIDIIWVRHPTNAENGDTSSQPVFGVSSGNPAQIPVPPSIPAGALEIGRNEVAGGATSTSSSGNSIADTAVTALPRAGKYLLSKADRPASASGAADATETAIFVAGPFSSPSGQVEVNAHLRLSPTSGSPVNALYVVRLRQDDPAGAQLAGWYCHITQTARDTSVPTQPRHVVISPGVQHRVYLTVQRINATGVAASGAASVSTDAQILIHEDAG